MKAENAKTIQITALDHTARGNVVDRVHENVVQVTLVGEQNYKSVMWRSETRHCTKSITVICADGIIYSYTVGL